MCDATATIYTTEEYDTYQWSGGLTTDSITVGPGFYSVNVTLEGFCPGSATPVEIAEATSITPVIDGNEHTCFGFIVPRNN
ncbi:MAG: hypothetical protein R2850_09800 [Bacteroidia bacterium]